MAIYGSLGPLSRLIADIPWPVDFFSPEDLPAFLNSIYVLDYENSNLGTGFSSTFWFAFEEELAVAIPGLEGLKLVLGGGEITGLTFVTASLTIRDKATLTLSNIRLALRFDPSILKPATLNEGDPVGEFVEILVEGSLSINSSFDISVEGFDAFKLSPTMIGDTGIIISAEDVKLDLSRTTSLPEVAAAGFDQSFIGVFIGKASVRLPDGLPSLVPKDLFLINCAIGSGGVSGQLVADYSPKFNKTKKVFEEDGAGELFGIPFGIERVRLHLKQNSFRESGITGKMLLPFFDEIVEVEISLNLDGSMSVRLTPEGGLKKLIKENVLRIDIESIGFQIKDGVFTAKLGGKITPLFAADDIDWPAFDIKELSIDSNGNVHLDGGWIDLPKQYSVDFYGFNFEVTKIGFGKTDDGGKFIGFSGNLKLVEDFPNCGSVEGLRIIWYDEPGKEPRITFNGVGIEFEKKGIVSFKGAVAYREISEGTTKKHRFDGAISLKLPKLKGIEIAATLVFGSESGPQGHYTFFAIYAAGEFPKGIPLFGSNLGLYGVAGLFGLNVVPNKKAEEEWYEGWYKRPQIGVTDIQNKWTNRNGGLALGAGATIGTVGDNGHKFSGKFLLAIVFPGPILLLEGKANILKDRAKLSDDPTFRALAVLDEQAGTFLLGLDAHYTKDDDGALLDIRGSAEAFFNLNDAGDWHLYLGKDEPRDKRIRAQAFKRIFQPAAYFMLDPDELRMGIWYGLDKQWGFSRLKVVLQAWIESNVRVSWNPNQFQGTLSLQGSAKLRAFGRGVGLNVSSDIEADVFKPYHLLGKLRVGIGMPWPISDISKTITLEWGPELAAPDLPDPLDGIAIEHLKVTTSWPLLPTESGDHDADDPDIPVVPLDSRPHITFSRSMNDEAFVAGNPQPVDWELIGDPAKGGIARASYTLAGVALHKWDKTAWTLVANKGATSVSAPSASAVELYGSWAPVPAEGDKAGEKIGQTKLWIWSKTPFDYTRHTQRKWDEWFTNRFKRYPCIDLPADRVICCDFADIAPGTQLSSPWRCPDQPSIVLSWLTPASIPLTVLDQPVEALSHALCLPGVIPNPVIIQHNRLTISLLEPAKSVEIIVAEKESIEDRVCINFETGGMQDGPNPRVESVFGFTEGVRFQVRDASGALLNQTTINSKYTHLGTFMAFDCEVETEIVLPCAASIVDLVITLTGVPVTITAFDEENSLVRMVFPQLGDQQCDYQPIPVRLTGGAIKRVVIRTEQGETRLQEICFRCGGAGRFSTMALDTQRRRLGPIISTGGRISIAGENLSSVEIQSEGELCIVQICATIGADAGEVARRQAMAEHLQEGLARFSQIDEVLEPDTYYRIAVQTRVNAESFHSDVEFSGYLQPKTRFAYFRTEGPPGLTRLSLPRGATEELAVHNKDGKIVTVTDSGGVGEVDSLDQLPDGTRAILVSELNDLTPYVRQTIPPTVAFTGKPLLPRPVYRAYDVGVEFNENYVEALYRKARRDLGLYLYDNNNRPVRDAQGRLILLDNRWGTTKDHTLDESEGRWISLIRERNCASIDPSVIPHESTLTSQAEGRVLDADTVYEARLVPLLMHVDSPVDLTGWSRVGDSSQWAVQGHRELKGHAATVSGQVVSLDGRPDLSGLDASKDVILLDDDSATSHGLHRILSYDNSSTVKTLTVQGTPALTGSSTSWRIPARGMLIETSGKETTLVGGDPEWKDYRFSVTVRSTTDNRVGVVFRRNEAGDNYSFVIDPIQRTAQLSKVIRANLQLLKTAAFVFTSDTDHLITIEAIGATLQAYVNGLLVLSVTDNTILSGAIGLYSGGDPVGTVRTEFGIRPTVSFADVRIEDFSSAAPVVYRFKFVTSRYTNFFHHIHSYQDETWLAEATIDLPGSEEESRAFEALFSQLPTQATQTRPAQVAQNPTEVQVTRIVNNQPPIAFLVQSLEPLNWPRVALEVKRAPAQNVQFRVPGLVKLTDVSFGPLLGDESVTLLLRETADLSGYRVEYNQLANPIDDTTWQTYFTFGSEPRLAAGTRIRVYSGNQLSVPPAEPGILQRFVPTGSDQGESKFPSNGIYMRVSDPGSVEGHRRPFLPPAAYNTVDPGNLRVIRKGDGTAFFLILTTDSSSAEHRLVMTYHRDKGNSDPGIPVLSEAGNQNAEIVTVDIPWQTNAI